MTARAVGIALGFLADVALGDPQRWHPVAGFGRAATWLERRTYGPSHARGVVHVAGLAGAVMVGGVAIQRAAGSRTAEAGLVAAATWCALGGRSLHCEAVAVETRLRRGDLDEGRLQVGRLVGRATSDLDADGITRATVESVAENTSDAVVAPLIWAAAAGVPGVLGYRAINTLDAMIGHRSDRYREFGWAAARLDDAVNLLPARATALLAAAAAPVVGGSSSAALHIWRRDASRHPSPNAGPVEAAFAGALGRTLGGRNVYGDEVEDRGTLGQGPAPGPADIARAVRLARAVDLLACGAAAALATWFRR